MTSDQVSKCLASNAMGVVGGRNGGVGRVAHVLE